MLRRLPHGEHDAHSPQRAAKRLCLIISLGIAFPLGMTFERYFQPPWTLVGWVRHLVAASSCEAARRVGLAPARQGMPGFWQRHDTDRDGIACELSSPKAGGYWLG